MVKIESAKENDFIKRELLAKIGNVAYGWTGLSDSLQEGTWKWTDGTLTGYTNWAKDEPNDHGDDHNCVEIRMGRYNNFDYNAHWNDKSCSKFHWFICEIP